MSEGIKWLVLSMLVSLSAGNYCNSSGNCSCQWTGVWTWEIQCPSAADPKFIVRLNSHTGNYQVECFNATSWSEFRYKAILSTCRVGATLTIEQCPLPDESFDRIANSFDLVLMKSLTFTSHMNLSSTLTRRHLWMLSAPTGLNLSSNGLTELPSDLFRNLTRLQRLDLSFNEIAVLPPDIFHDLRNLRRLDLSNNAISFVDRRLFDDCKNLNQLLLRHNLLKSLDHWAFRHSGRPAYVAIFDASGSMHFESSVDSGPLVLDLSSNEFSTLPEKPSLGIRLTELRLSHNRGNLTTLPPNFLNKLSKLKEVIFVRNNLTSLPENIFWGSSHLQNIDLHGNSLSTLSENIFKNLKALTFLDLSANGLNHVPEGLFRTLSSLQQLNLARNGIASLSANLFENLDSLLVLNLEFNCITNIYWKTFRKLPNIQLIRLSHNSLDLIKFNGLKMKEFFHVPTIQNIFLDHNNFTGGFHIEKVDSEIPASLQLVDLTYNHISYVSVESPLIGSRDVAYDLRHNNLRDVFIYDEISSKMNILVDDNPLDCGCKIYAPLKYMHEARAPQSGKNLKITLGNVLCSQPNWMRGIPVATLRLETFTCRPDRNYGHVRCAQGCDCWWRPHDRTRIVDCSSRNFEKMPDEITNFVPRDWSREFTELDRFVDGLTQWSDWGNTRVELDLSNNSLTEIPTLKGTEYEHVEVLVLSYNNVSRLSFDVLPSRLKVLRVDNNDLRTLNATTVETVMKSTTLKEVNLEKNPWNCDAETRNRLVTLEEKFGINVRYSFDTRTCLDSRQATSSEKTDRLHISYARF